MKKLLAVAFVLLASTSARAAVDGLDIKADFCPGGTPGCAALVQVQNNHTGFGDTYPATGNYSPGSELDQLYVFKTETELAINITGNMEYGQNGWVIFLDTKTGGENVLDDNTGDFLSGQSGNQFDAGFEPDYAVIVNAANTPTTAYFDLVDLANNTSRYLGSVVANGVGGELTGGNNPNGSRAAFNGTNNVGVTSVATKTAAEHQADAATAQKGLELRLNFVDVDMFANAEAVKVMAVLTSRTAYLSNQTLPGIGGGATQLGNLGFGPTNFADEQVAPGPQYATKILILQSGGILDGDNIPQESGSNTLVATQNNYTGFGDGSGGGTPASNGSELDAMFIRNTSTALEVGITGNLESNQNYLVLFLQTGFDGVADTGMSIPEGAGPPPDLFPAMTGTIFDAGFNPTHAIAVNSFTVEEPEGSGTFVPYAFVDIYDLRSNTGRFVGRVQVGSGSGILDTGNNPNGLQMAFSNANELGVTDDNNKTSAENETDALTADSGFEFVIPFKDIGLAGRQIKYLAAITGRTAFFSNQTLPGLGGGYGNLGTSPIDFNETAGLQYGVYNITAAIPVEPFSSVSDLKLAPDGTLAQLTSTVSAVLSEKNEFYLQDSWPKDYSGILTVGQSAGRQVSQNVTVQGFLARKGGERAIIAESAVTAGAGVEPEPLAIVQKSLGGATVGQTPGIDGGVGANNVGLLVKVAGKATSAIFGDDGSQYFYVNDGSDLFDNNIFAYPGVRVDVPTTQTNVPADGQFVVVTGVSSVYSEQGVIVPRVRTRDDNDVVIH